MAIIPIVPVCPRNELVKAVKEQEEIMPSYELSVILRSTLRRVSYFFLLFFVCLFSKQGVIISSEGEMLTSHRKASAQTFLVFGQPTTTPETGHG